MPAIVIRIVSKLFEWTVFLAMAGMVVVLSVNVFLRYVIHRPIAWAEEISVLFTVWVVLLGAALVQKKEEHVAITYLFDSLPEKAKTMVMVAVNLCISLVLVVHIVSSWNLFKLQMKSSMLGVDLSMGLFALAILVGMAGMFLFSVGSVVQRIKGRGVPKLSQTEEESKK